MGALMTESQFQTEVPADAEAERQVIGACLLNPENIPSVMARLTPEDFWSLRHRAVFAACCDLAVENSPVSVATIVRHKEVKEESHESIAQLMEGVLPDDWEFWADRVAGNRKLRDILNIGAEARQLVKLGPENADNAVAKLERMLTNVGSAVGETGTVGADEVTGLLRQRLNRYIHDPDRITGLATGWGRFDRILDGLQPGAVTIVYAPTSRFKSQFVLNIAHSIVRQGIPSYWFTTEMPAVQVWERLLQLEAGVNIREARWNRELYKYEQQLLDCTELIEDYPVWLCDRSELDIGFLRQAVMRMKRWHGIEFVLIDLVDMVSSAKSKDDDVANMKSVMRSLKDIAKSAGVHILLTTHIVKLARDFRAIGKASLDPEEMTGTSAKAQDSDAAISLMVVKQEWASTGTHSSWKAMTRDEIITATREQGAVNLFVSITKNRSGEMDDLVFEVDLSAGGRIQPV